MKKYRTCAGEHMGTAADGARRIGKKRTSGKINESFIVSERFFGYNRQR
ncbi:hypothetical protein CLOM621_05512 [Clostridium sp. M62/1]|nr:hypothetical protein CLOM621_05512 [Clostridium sp. M62/1]CBK77437.1 hypothetical protein CLS_19240 [[Clostridium] cf. saccharolyticum K10]